MLLAAVVVRAARLGHVRPRSEILLRCASSAASSNSSAEASSELKTPAYYTVTDAAPALPATPMKKTGKYALRGIQGHTKKLNPVARQVVGQCYYEAMAQMAFHPQKRSDSMSTVLQRAAWGADFYHNLRPDDLMVEEAWTGKHLCAPRIRYHSKGRAGRSHKRTSMLTVRLREMTPAEKLKLVKFPYMPTAASRAKVNPRGY